ncbi:hypothetical protein PHMEG_0007569 [Phytophthora megakarya]|uniref:DDE-1 domain-containing protein n=1 Tax=Phytophthora megakarya TaxID=4795 RepID=A0A225WKX7_9STRA|nr:hypothetical protein PHMEG_0007569 [Phytophthora megakarya]
MYARRANDICRTTGQTAKLPFFPVKQKKISIRFMRRRKLSIRARTRQGQATPEDAQEGWSKFLSVTSQTYSPRTKQLYSSSIFLVRLSPLAERRPCGSSVAAKTRSAPQQCFLLIDMTPFLVLKARVSRHKSIQTLTDSKRHGFGVRLWKEISRLQRDHRCQIYGNPTAWWNAHNLLNFLEYHFGNRVNMDDKLLLLRDDFSGHLTPEVTHVSMLYLSVPTGGHSLESTIQGKITHSLGGLPSQTNCTPPHSGEASAGKSKENSKQVEELQNSIEVTVFEMQTTKRSCITDWITDSWSGLSSSAIISGFAKVGLVVDNHCLAESSEEDCVEKISDLFDRLADL